MLGEFKSTLDAKGRMNIPVKLREEIGNDFVLAKNIGEHCIKIYSMEEWQKLMEKINGMPSVQTQKLKRFLCGTAYEVSADKQGRVSIQPPLREYAGLSSDVVVVGMGTSAEIWDKAEWKRFCDAADDEGIYNLALELEI